MGAAEKIEDLKRLETPPEDQFMKPLPFVLAVLEKNAVKVTYDLKVTVGGEQIGSDELARRIRIEWDARKGTREKRASIEDILTEWIEAQCRARVREFSEKLKFEPREYPAGKDPLSKFVRALVEETDSAFELHRAVIYHFIWQIKRKLKQQKVTDHLCPIIKGKTGSGKTEAISRLVEPVKELSLYGDLGSFSDQREYFIFAKYYVVVLDEFARAARSDVDSMKRIITAESISYRPLYANRMAVYPMVSTFIGATNRFVGDVVIDTTSMRRYYQLITKNKCDWDDVNDIDYLALWKSVDEESDSIIKKYEKELKKAQEEIRPRSSVEEFVEDLGLKDFRGQEFYKIGARKLFDKYLEWMKDNNNGFAVKASKFGREVKEFLECITESSGRFYRVARDPYDPGAGNRPHCTECKKEKPHSEFPGNPIISSGKTGLHLVCTECLQKNFSGNSKT